jgi:hypothetical protein
VPTIRGDQKPALTTSVMSCAIVGCFAFTMWTLELWLSAIANAGISVAWGVLAFQRYTAFKRQGSVLEQIETEVIDVALAGEEYDAAGKTEKDASPA